MDQSYETHLSHGNKVCEMLSRSDRDARNYGPEKTDKQPGLFLY